jgi:NAD(P)-dependent dehydrogenase (short-subunit alcohol dehydrogenase family)
MTTEKTVAFITGANKGIGFETARELGEKGITVVMGSRDPERGKKAAATLAEMGVTADVLQFDVTAAEDRDAAYRFFEEKYGKLDILVNNAAINLRDATCSVPEENLRETFDTNFFAQVAITQKLLPLIRKSPAGRIVNLSSALGSLTLLSDPKSWIYSYKAFAYGASKTALNAFTVNLAYELRDTKIKVNSADPGWVKTDMGGPSAMLELREGARTSVLLATLPEDGPTGTFQRWDQEFPW